MRIGFITADLSHKHGWAHYSLELITALQREGIATTVISSQNTDDTVAIESYQILPNLVPRERFLLPKLFNERGKVRQLLTQSDIIHCTVEPFVPLAYWSAGKRAFVQSIHGSYVKIDYWQRFPATVLYRRAINKSHMVCVSHYTAKVARQDFPQLRHIDVVPQGIDPERFARKTSSDRPIDGKIILTVGGIKERKGTIHAVRAMVQVRQQFADAQCVIIGNPAENSAYTKQVRAEIEKHNLQDCVHILGFVPEEELHRWYQHADIFVMPSINGEWTFEGYGLVLMEASSAGLPVIGTYDCGNEDAIDDGVTGFLVPQDNIDDHLPKAINKILSSPQLAKQMGEAGKQRAQEHTWANVARKTIKVYETIMRERK